MDTVDNGNMLSFMLRFEGSEEPDLSEQELAALFQHLVDTGLAWRLQGFYGRTAMDLIEAGFVTPNGVSA